MAKRAFDLGAELRKAGGPTGQAGNVTRFSRVSMDTREQIEYIDLDLIDPDPENFYSLEGIDELAGNIELVGLQQPLRVRDGERGHVVIVSGHRRRAACMLIRDGGSDMFKGGVPCIREKPDSSKEMQELRLIFANSQTRVMSAPELSRQAVKTRDLLGKLKAQGFDFQGRTRELVASVLQTSDSRVGRLTAIREKLAPELLTKFDTGRLGESVAYRLCQEDRKTQQILSLKLGPAVQDLTKDTVEKVLEQVKKPKEAEPEGGNAIVVHAEDLEESDKDAVEMLTGSASPAFDGLKKYLDERRDEDRRFWKSMEAAADDLILHSFAAGALPNRKENIDMLRLDLRTKGSFDGSDGSWSGSNKGIRVGVGRNSIERTWFDAFDALAAIAITRWRRALVDQKNKRNVKLKENVPTVGTEPTWQTGEPPRDGRYLCTLDLGLNKPTEQTCDYRNGEWTAYGRPVTDVGNVVGWWPLPERG